MRQFSILLVLILTNLLSHSTQGQRKTINGEDSGPVQSWNVKLKNLIRKLYPNYYNYNDDDIRPSAPEDEETPTATQVEIYFRDFRVTGLSNYYDYRGTMSPRLDIAADLVTEYTDPRRSFDTSEINGASYVRIPGEGRVWTPELRCYNASQGYSTSWTIIQPNYYSNQELLVSSSGRVFRRIPVSIMQIVGTGDVYNSEATFKFQISPQLYTLDEVKLNWRLRNPVELVVADGLPLPVVTTGTCKRTEDDGSFGIRKFSCVELTIRTRGNYGMTITPTTTTPSTYFYTGMTTPTTVWPA
ncbi:Glutamate-gated chloride channel [Folsomia candida]|uniref:Glutamate-gated chloride channel n=1 Tax=Folsomia candida TaxID=158441 RepID=A0A226D9C2_FOLCA|nr:Glutamate-gated chloride channel [Folsomia candida]